MRWGRATNLVKKLTPSLPSDSFRAVAIMKKGRPRPLRKAGAYRPNGVRGLGAEGTPTRR
jgi:hypothetical protein